MIQNAQSKWFIAILVVALTTAAAQAVMIETVPVGCIGNTPDDGYGAVGYAYYIGRYEVTAGQYTEFLNAVAGKDTYGLYNTKMWWGPFGCGIEQTYAGGRHNYSVASDWADRPVNYVSWYDAARYGNWLTTGSTENGVYEFYDGVLQGIMDHQTAASTYGTAYFIPTENEWYKPAYHKNDGVTGNYFDYPTSSDFTPSNDLIDPDPGNNATFHDAGYTIGDPYYRTEVGAHENSESPYGTFDQGGNVWEWNETPIGADRGCRGGGFDFGYLPLLASNRGDYGPANESAIVGFRIASTQAVPEPGSLAMLAGLALTGWLCRRRKRAS